MATSSLLRTGESVPAVKGHTTGDLGPSDTSDTGSDIRGGPGIVGAVSGVLADHGLSVASLESVTRDAPMAGGRLFDARAVVSVPAGVDLALVQADLEEIASEILVEVALTPDDA